jgi:hypothetical protein
MEIVRKERWDKRKKLNGNKPAMAAKSEAHQKKKEDA